VAALIGGATAAGAAPAGVDALDRFLPAHPLAGAETAGFGASAAELLDGAVWAVCPPRAGAPLDALCAAAPVLDALGARLVACTPADHDDAVARTSHVPHVAAQALAGLLAERPAGLGALSGGGFRDMTRVAKADSALWMDILRLNRERSIEALDELIAALERSREALAAGAWDGIATAWADGARARESVERARWAEPNWAPATLPAPDWEPLLRWGREGRAFRRLRAPGGGTYELEVA
jgi:prephenate dehydrogenase